MFHIRRDKKHIRFELNVYAVASAFAVAVILYCAFIR